MRLAVLGSLESWYVKDLLRAAEGRHEITPLTFRQLVGQLDTTAASASSGGYPLDDCDCLLIRTMPPGSLEQVVFRMDVLAQLAHGGTCVINPPRALEAAVDKYLATAKLRNAGLEVPSTIGCQTSDDAMAAFERLGRDVVVKPLFGGEGRGITRIADEALAARAFKMLEQLGAVMYLQEFVPHDGYDIRLFVVGSRVLGMQRRNNADWRTNVSRGAETAAWEVSAEFGELARRAADAVGAPLAGVDLLPARDGRWLVLEVNAVPGWRALAKTLKMDVAKMVLEFLNEVHQSNGAPGEL